MIFTQLEKLKQSKIVLCSSSKSRAELLRKLNLFDFQVYPSNFEENLDKAQGPIEYCNATCKGKMDEVIKRIDIPWDILIFADSICDLDGKIIEKPGSEEEAAQFLRWFSGRSHFLHTSVIIVGKQKTLYHLESTELHFEILSDDMIQGYVKSGQWVGISGGYNLEQQSVVLVSKIVGDYSNIIGLPLSKVTQMIAQILHQQ